jgi:hypothetical protein
MRCDKHGRAREAVDTERSICMPDNGNIRSAVICNAFCCRPDEFLRYGCIIRYPLPVFEAEVNAKIRASQVVTLYVQFISCIRQTW